MLSYIFCMKAIGPQVTLHLIPIASFPATRICGDWRLIEAEESMHVCVLIVKLVGWSFERLFALLFSYLLQFMHSISLWRRKDPLYKMS